MGKNPYIIGVCPMSDRVKMGERQEYSVTPSKDLHRLSPV